MPKSIIFLLILLLGFSAAHAQTQGQAQRPVYYVNPSWSPDGQRILFESTLKGEANIYVVNKDGSGLKQVTVHPSGQAAWSPDGQQIVYYRNIDRKLQLFTASASGENEQSLLQSETQDYGPSWSAKGVIAFMSNKTPQHIAHFLYSIHPDGTQLKRITDSSYDCMAPAWSPDGNKLLFIRGTWTSKTYRTITREEMQQLNKSAEVMVMNADGTGIQRIAGQSSSLTNPVWSANSRHIFLKKDLDSATLIIRVNSRGKKEKTICRINKTIGSFAVSPDGNTIVFEFAENKKYGIHVYEIKENREWKIIGDI